MCFMVGEINPRVKLQIKNNTTLHFVYFLPRQELTVKHVEGWSNVQKNERLVKQYCLSCGINARQAMTD